MGIKGIGKIKVSQFRISQTVDQMLFNYSSCKNAAGIKMLTCYLLLIFIIGHSSASSNDELGSIRQEIGLLRDENKEQNMEISLLKEMMKSQDTKIDKKITKELDRRMKYEESSVSGDHNHHSSGKTRQKRPFRLIPTVQKNKFDKNNPKKNDKNIILKDHQKTNIFYGPPTNCSDLSRLGYTLNGYFLVKRVITDTSNTEITNLDTVYCAFKQPEGSINLSTQETRVGLLKFIDDSNKSKYSSEANLNSIGRGAMNGNPSIRMANLINALGKCAGMLGNFNNRGQNLIQWDCNQHEKGQLWSWNETSLSSGDRHLCNGHGKCAGSRENSPSNIDLIQWEHFDEEGQRYHFVDSSSLPGFYLIKNDHGKCFSVPENKKDNGIIIYTNDCNSSEGGQNWKWKNI